MNRYLFPFAFAALIASQNSWAGIIITDSVVEVNGRQWAQPDMFINNSWLRINRLCPHADGICLAGAMLNDFPLAGWTWASQQDVQDLFNAYIGLPLVAPTSYAELNSTWAPEFFRDFRRTEGLPGIYEAAIGWSSSLKASTQGYWGALSNTDPGGGPYPEDQMTTEYAYTFTDTHSYLGAWFWRAPTDVPAPATLLLLGIGLAALGFQRRTHTSDG